MASTRNVPEPQAGSSRRFCRVAVVAQLVEQALGQPVGRVVLAQVVAQLLGHQVLVELLQQVARLLGVHVERDQRVVGQVADQPAQRGVQLVVPDVQVPAEEVALEEVADAKLREEAAALHLGQVGCGACSAS